MILCLVIFKYIEKSIKNDSKENILSKIGDISFGIFFIHMLILSIVNKIVVIFISNAIILTLTKSLLTLLISYITIKIFSKLTNKKFDYYLGF